MKTIRIKRLETGPEGTFGALFIDGKWFCVTLELSWNDNKVSKSSIPVGMYCCSRHESPRFGETFLVRDVPGRSDILFHVGNFPSNTYGCILLGHGVFIYTLTSKRGVSQSRDTVEEFMREMRGEDSFCLNVTEDY